MMRRAVLLLMSVCLSLLLNACAGPVKPWQRGNLAREDMALTPDPGLQKLRQQVFISKEASSGGYGQSAGGCGCN